MSSRDPLSTKDVAFLDQQATEKYGIPSLLLMESAGQQISDYVMDLISSGKGPSVCIFCGTGNNGGDGFVMARVLSQQEVPVEVFMVGDPRKIKGDAKTNYEIVRNLGIPVTLHTPELVIPQRAIVVDAMLGTGFKALLQPAFSKAIIQINHAKKNKDATVIAVDIPSGLNGDEGVVDGTVVQADETLTFAAIKPGLLKKESKSFVGKVKMIDIGIPKQLYDEIKRRK